MPFYHTVNGEMSGAVSTGTALSFGIVRRVTRGPKYDARSGPLLSVDNVEGGVAALRQTGRCFSRRLPSPSAARKFLPSVVTISES